MSSFLLSFTANTLITGGTAPTLEVLVGGTVVSSVTMSAGVTSYDVLADYTGSVPSSVSLRFAGSSGSFLDSVTIVAAAVNSSSLNLVTDLTATILLQAQTAAINAASSVYLQDTPTLGTTTITGTASDDGAIKGGNDADVVDGLAGNDWVYGRGGNDEINGGAGADYLFGEDGDDTILGGAGNDVLFGNSGDDIIFGEADNDFIIGGAGSDLLNGGAGNDGITGDAGDDIIFGGDGNDWLLGDAGNDMIFGDDGDDQLMGGAGNDSIAGGIGNDQLVGGTGDDLLAGGDGDDQIIGEAGADTASGGAGSDTMFGGDGDDIFAGGDDDDHVYGGDGNDTLSGDDGADTVVGGAGADTIDGDAGNDILHGHGLDATTISDILFNNPSVSYSEATGSFYQFVNANVNHAAALAAANAATLNGVTGHLATITSTAENDFIASIITDNSWHAATDDAVNTEWVWETGAEAGMQFSAGATAVNNMYENWSGGQPQNNAEHNALIYTDGSWHDWPDTSTHSYVIEWEGGLFSDDNAIDTISGGAGNDWIYGYGGADILDGGSGNDVIFGGSGADVIDGASGDDTINGGDGDDTLNGGADDDLIIDASGDNILNGGTGNDVLDTRLSSTGQTSIQDQVDAILAANANLTYSAVTGNFYEHVSTGSNLSWTAASTAAAANTVNGVAGHLATVTSSGENDVLVNLYDSTNSWIGGQDTGTEGVWQWVEGPEAGTTFWNGGTAGSGGSAPSGVYANFDASQPNDSDGSQDYLYYLSSSDQWADAPIIGGSGFVNITSYFVEWEGSLLLTPPTATSGANELNGGDGNDTLYSGAQESLDATIQTILADNAGISYSAETNSFYQFVNNNISWTAAETAANSVTLTGLTGVNGHLATITSQAENDFIGTIIGNTTAWTAGSDAASEGTWIWTAGPEAGMQFWAGDQTGSSVNGHYNNWTAGEPSNGNAGWDYAKYLAADDWWADRGNDGYIIEWEADSLLATVNKTTLYGGDGSDTLYASDDGIDIAVFQSGDSGVDTIIGFEANERDAIDISDLLTGFNYTTSAIDDFVRVTESGGNSTISVDGNGGAGGFYTDIVTLNGVTGIDLYQWVAADNLIMS